MASHSLVLGYNPVLLAGPIEHTEGLDSHGVVQLGMASRGKVITINEVVTVRHESLPPIYNLALECETLPSWLASLVITPTGALIPPIPGPLPGVPFLPGLPPLAPAAYVLPSAPGEPFIQVPALIAAHVPGGFGHFSVPSTTYGFTLVGATSPGAGTGLYEYGIYVTGSYSIAGIPRMRLGKLTLCCMIQAADPFDQVQFVPAELQDPTAELQDPT